MSQLGVSLSVQVISGMVEVKRILYSNMLRAEQEIKGANHCKVKREMSESKLKRVRLLAAGRWYHIHEGR